MTSKWLIILDHIPHSIRERLIVAAHFTAGLMLPFLIINSLALITNYPINWWEHFNNHDLVVSDQLYANCPGAPQFGLGGGALQDCYSTWLNLTRCNFTRCGTFDFPLSGGAIWCQDIDRTIFIDVIFDGCFCTTGGGAIYYNTSLSLALFRNCCFENLIVLDPINDTLSNGGAVLFSSGGNDATFLNCLFENCSCPLYGTILFNATDLPISSLKLSSCVFCGCDANSGAGIYALNAKSVTVLDSAFHPGFASDGSIALTSINVAQTRITNTSFLIDKTACPNATAIVLAGSGLARFERCQFSTIGSSQKVSAIQSTLIGATQFWIPMCFDQSRFDAISFPTGNQPIGDELWFYNCSGPVPTWPTGTGTGTFSPSMSFTPPSSKSLTETPAPTDSVRQSRTARATKTAVPRKTPSVSRSPSLSKALPSASEAATSSASCEATATVPQSPTASQEPTSDSQGMSTRDVALVSVGSVVGAGLIIAVAVLCVIRRKKALPNLDSSVLYTQTPGDGDPPAPYT
jgi:hypothetical protein